MQIWFVGNYDKFPASEVARIAKKLVKTGKITGQEQTFRRGVKDANDIRETACTEAGAAVLCSVTIGKFKMKISSTTTAAAVVGELTQTHNEALVDFLTAENTLFVVGSVGIVALSTACISFVNQKGEDSEEIKALVRLESMNWSKSWPSPRSVSSTRRVRTQRRSRRLRFTSMNWSKS